MNQLPKGTKQEKTLAGKTVVITGASSGAGLAAAIAFAKQGAKLILAARNRQALEQAAEECKSYGAAALAVTTDVTAIESMQFLAAQAIEYCGCIDVWINNAGVLAAGAFDETPMEVNDQVLRTNLLGYMHGAYAVLPYFKQQGYGILINNISVGGWFPVPYGAAYSASKFGLRGFGEALQAELSSWQHIHVCNLFPAFLDTPGIQHASNYTGVILKPAPPVYNPEKVAQAMVQLALHPKRSMTVGSVASLLRCFHFLMPGLTGAATAKFIKTYLTYGKPAPFTSGNVFTPVDYGTSIYGGWGNGLSPKTKRTAVALLTGAAVLGLFALSKARAAGKSRGAV